MWLRRLSLLFLLTSFIVSAQSERAKKLNALIGEGKYQECLEVADSLLNLSNFSEEYFYIYSRKGDAYYYLGDIKNSLRNYLLAVDRPEIKLLENKKALQEAASNVGFCYSDLGMPDKALPYYKSSFDLSVELNDSSEVAIAYYNMSNAHLKQGNIEMGINMLENAYAIDKQRRDTAALGFDLNAMGYASLDVGNFEDAIKYFKESIYLLSKSSGNYNSLGTRYNNLAKAFLRAGVYDSALHYNKLSTEIHEHFNDEINLAERWINRAMILNEMERPQEAVIWGNKAKEKVVTLDKSALQIKVNEALISSYEKLGDLQTAVALSKRNIGLAEESGMLPQLQYGYTQYAELLNAIGRSQEGFKALQTSRILSDSLKLIEGQRASAELAIRYEVDKIESEKAILELENQVSSAQLEKEKTTNFWLTILVVIVLITGAVITYSLISRSRVKEQLMQSQISELRLQIKQLIDYQPENSSLSIEQLNKSLKEPLSDREFEVLQMAMTDKNNSEIAEKIFVSTNTVKYHLKNVYQKLGVSNRKEAMKFAFQATSG